MKEEDKVVAFKLAADLVEEEETQNCEVRPVIFTCKQTSLFFLTVLLDNCITQVTYGGDGLQIWTLGANILNKQ